MPSKNCACVYVNPDKKSNSLAELPSRIFDADNYIIDKTYLALDFSYKISCKPLCKIIGDIVEISICLVSSRLILSHVFELEIFR